MIITLPSTLLEFRILNHSQTNRINNQKSNLQNQEHPLPKETKKKKEQHQFTYATITTSSPNAAFLSYTPSPDEQIEDCFIHRVKNRRGKQGK